MYISILLVVLSFSVSAVPICPPAKDVLAGPSAVSKYFFKVFTFGLEDRRTLKDFAKESGESESVIASRYGASGDLYCGKHFGQAMVVLKGDLIVGPAHILYDNRDCEQYREAKTCNFYLKENGKLVKYEIEKEISEGYACPDNDSIKTSTDWVIMRLKKKVGPTIKPYELAKPTCTSDRRPLDVVFVAKSGDWGRVKGVKMTETPRHYGNCRILKGNCGGKDEVTSSDCDMAPGASGGGLFTRDKIPKLIAMNVGYKKECPGSESEKVGDYNPECWASLSVPLQDEFLQKVQRAAED